MPVESPVKISGKKLAMVKGSECDWNTPATAFRKGKGGQLGDTKLEPEEALETYWSILSLRKLKARRVKQPPTQGQSPIDCMDVCKLQG